MQIINVDDDEDDRGMFCMAVKRIDPEIQCTQVESAEDVIGLLKHTELIPDLMFIDINMPRMNGYECVREIYQYPNLKNTLIVMFSSTFNPRDQAEFDILGIRYLLKTSNLKELTESISGLIGLTLAEGRQKM